MPFQVNGLLAQALTDYIVAQRASRLATQAAERAVQLERRALQQLEETRKRVDDLVQAEARRG